MLETIREYAAERLARDGEGVELRRRRLRWLTRYLEATAPQLFRRADPARVRDLFLEEANVRAAFGDAVETKAVDDVFGLLALMLRAFLEAGRLGELRRWARLALDLDRGRDDQRATAVLALGLEDPERTDDLLLARELYQRAGATRHVAIAHACIGMALSDKEDFEGAARVFDEAARMFAALGDEEGELVARGNLVSAIAARASTPGELDAAIALMHERLEDPREDPFDVLPSRMQLCSLLLARGRLGAARDELIIAAEQLETLGQHRLLPELLSLAAHLSSLEGQAYDALGLAAAAVSLGRELGVVPWQGFELPTVDAETAMRARAEGEAMTPAAALGALRAFGEREVTGDE